MAELPEIIKIDDITSGKIEPSLIYDEIERLKVEINVLRNDMSSLVKSLATIPEGSSQGDYYRNVSEKLKVIQKSIKNYCNEYNRLLPIINLAQIKLGNEAEVIPNEKKPNGTPQMNKFAKK